MGDGWLMTVAWQQHGLEGPCITQKSLLEVARPDSSEHHRGVFAEQLAEQQHTIGLPCNRVVFTALPRHASHEKSPALHIENMTWVLGYACGDFSRQTHLLQELSLTVRRLLQCIAEMHLQALLQGLRVDY